LCFGKKISYTESAATRRRTNRHEPGQWPRTLPQKSVNGNSKREVNCTGQPAISIPGGFSSNGLPIGVQLIGRMGGDNCVLELAEKIEELNPWQQHYKKLSGEK